MDILDRKILNMLRKNSRTPYIKIAKILKISEGTVRRRVKKLHQEGKIAFSLEVLTGHIGVIVGIKTNSKISTTTIVKNIKNIEGIEKIFEVTGEFDIICITGSDSPEGLNRILERIRTTKNVDRTESFTILRSE